MNHPGDRLKALRKDREWSQQTLADKAGVSKSAVAMIESHQRDGKQDTLAALAEVLGTSVGYLLLGQEEPSAEREAIPLEGYITERGEAVGQRLSREVAPGALFRSDRTAFTYPTRVAVPGSDPAWWVMTAQADLTKAPIRRGDQLVIAPGLTPREGDWVIVTSDTPDYHELFDASVEDPTTALRQIRTIDGDTWLWPLADGDRPDELESYWRVLGVVVDHRRRPDAYSAT